MGWLHTTPCTQLNLEGMGKNYINSVIKFSSENLKDISNANESIILMKLLSFALNDGEIQKSVTCTKVYLANLIGSNEVANQVKNKKISRIAQKLIDKGYLKSVNLTHIKYKGKTLTTTKWVFGAKSIEILEKMLNQKAPPKSAKKKKTTPSTKAATPKKAVANEVEKKTTKVAAKKNKPLVQVYEEF